MKDNEIIKALEYCLAQGITSECERCRDKIGCRDTLLRDALDLINSQKAEIERLKNECFCLANERDAYKDVLDTAIAEARKEFAERLKKKTYPFPCAIGVENAVTIRGINDLLAEMESEGE